LHIFSDATLISLGSELADNSWGLGVVKEVNDNQDQEDDDKDN